MPTKTNNVQRRIALNSLMVKPINSLLVQKTSIFTSVSSIQKVRITLRKYFKVIERPSQQLIFIQEQVNQKVTLKWVIWFWAAVWIGLSNSGTPRIAQLLSFPSKQLKSMFMMFNGLQHTPLFSLLLIRVDMLMYGILMQIKSNPSFVRSFGRKNNGLLTV